MDKPIDLDLARTLKQLRERPTAKARRNDADVGTPKDPEAPEALTFDKRLPPLGARLESFSGDESVDDVHPDDVLARLDELGSPKPAG